MVCILVLHIAPGTRKTGGHKRHPFLTKALIELNRKLHTRSIYPPPQIKALTPPPPGMLGRSHNLRRRKNSPPKMESRSTGRPVTSTVQGPQTHSRQANWYVLPTDLIPITECGRSHCQRIMSFKMYFLCVMGQKAQNVLLSLDVNAQHVSPNRQ